MVFAVLILFCRISLSYGQLSATLMPQEHRAVCRGETISHYCFGDGSSMLFYSPPTVNKTDALSFFDDENSCFMSRNSLAVAAPLVNPARNSSIAGTFVQYTSNEGDFSVFCQVSMGQNFVITSSIFSVKDTPSPADNFTYKLDDCQSKAAQGEETEETLVNFSWVSSRNAREYSLQLDNRAAVMIRSLENSVSLLLPYGNYSATLCSVNSCGRACSNHSVSIPRPTPQQETTTATAAVDDAACGGAVIGLAFGGVVCVFIGVILSYVSAVFYIKKRNKQGQNQSEEMTIPEKAANTPEAMESDHLREVHVLAIDEDDTLQGKGIQT